MLLRHRICVTINREDMDNHPTRFNPKHAHIIGTSHDWSLDQIRVYLAHPKFPETPEGCECLTYHESIARRKFPYIFKDTPPKGK